ncbi:DNA repair protein [Palleronia abyssalis]|uniref:DNA repair protein n=1 Tax=Palleronia abyssalis TaxID=1501240 RepID=A0A2R8BV25_9RHOB|nr:DNA repair protein [Palleronia abyssalis]SPJ23990.1 hypothetical protein PAA8504_01812 [Palleronia abyssalis]
MRSQRHTRFPISAYFQWIATTLIFLACIAATGATVAGMLGYLPTLTMPLQFGDTIYPEAGLLIQIGLVLFLLTVLCALPAGFRVLRLERTHRDFTISMSDVAEAYHLCHAADREGVFRIASEYDAVKERIVFLRSHPNLRELEPEVLEAAAEMSYASRELAEIYSDENVSRAQGFLRHREEEIALFEDRIDHALSISRELRRHKETVEVEEAAMESRLQALQEEFGDLLDELGFSRTRQPANVIALPHATAAE